LKGALRWGLMQSGGKKAEGGDWEKKVWKVLRGFLLAEK